jgi:hypothetical protein
VGPTSGERESSWPTFCGGNDRPVVSSSRPSRGSARKRLARYFAVESAGLIRRENDAAVDASSPGSKFQTAWRALLSARLLGGWCLGVVWSLGFGCEPVLTVGDWQPGVGGSAGGNVAQAGGQGAQAGAGAAAGSPEVPGAAGMAGDAGLDPLLPWSTGFEDGIDDYTRAGGYCYADPPASYEIVDSPVHGGQRAAAFSLVADESGLQTRCVLRGDLPQSAYYSAYFYLPTAPRAANNWNLIHFRNREVPAPRGIWDVSAAPQPDGSVRIYVFDHLRMSTRMTAAKAPIGQWFEIGVYWERAKTPNGQFAVYIDGVLALDLQNLVTDDSTVTEWYVGNLADSLSPPDYTLYVDDVSIREMP